MKWSAFEMHSRVIMPCDRLFFAVAGPTYPLKAAMQQASDVPSRALCDSHHDI